MDLDPARVVFLANKKEFDRKKAERKAHRKHKKSTGAATTPVITGLMRREAAARAKVQDLQLPPNDRD